MKLGIERVLKENFVNLGQIIAVSADDIEAQKVILEPPKEVVTMAKVEESLENVKKAIKGLGGRVELVSVNERSVGEVRVKFDGPTRLKKGLELILKDVPGVTIVSMETFDIW
jgi:Fe-S cluster biogenesis protein NfuA